MSKSSNIVNLCKNLTAIFLLFVIQASSFLPIYPQSKLLKKTKDKSEITFQNKLKSKTNSQELFKKFGQLPVSFEPNYGQTDASVKFLSRGKGYSIFLTEEEAVLTLQRKKQIKKTKDLIGNIKKSDVRQ